VAIDPITKGHGLRGPWLSSSGRACVPPVVGQLIFLDFFGKFSAPQKAGHARDFHFGFGFTNLIAPFAGSPSRAVECQRA
jgi:hypothetical protein